IRAFGFATTAGEICNAIIMFCSPWIINRIGAKNTLLVAGLIMTIRITGSAFATTATEVVILKMLHALEVPFLLVGAFKYITGVFDTRLSATIYLIGFQFSKQLAAIFLSTFAGHLYDRMGFQNTYLVLGGIVLAVTVLSAFTLSSTHKPAAPSAETATAQTEVRL
ncbi:oligosaccharide MFS transporter, partial [Escherichia coli]|nr:oligosaccharide MFS transporter [Escherichia coli]